MFYLLGSLLFAVAMMAAFAVMFLNFAQYRRAMGLALRNLDMNGFGPAPSPSRIETFTLPAGMTVRARQVAA